MNVMCKFKSKICPVTRYLILHPIMSRNHLNTLIYAKNMAHLKKNVFPPWFKNAFPLGEVKGGGQWPLLGAKSVKYPSNEINVI